MTPSNLSPFVASLIKGKPVDALISNPSIVADDPFSPARNYIPILDRNGIWLHYLECCEGIVGHHAEIGGQRFISFSTYNYLGYSGDPRVSEAAKEAIDQYGTSVSASRLVAGERPINQQLEQQIAELIGAEDCLVYTSGHGTNVTTLGCLFGPKDLVVYDVLSHNSIRQGIRLSGATSFRFSHNNVQHLDNLLRVRRRNFERALIITEGVFSMDGDIPPVPELIALKRRHNALLMVDEAHSMGVVGPTGRGIADHFQLNPADVDIWMGTLSKTLASCGGYIAGRRELVESLRYAAPGFVYSCGISPPNAAAALAAVRLLRKEPERIQMLRENVNLFKSLADAGGLDTGVSKGSAVVPIILGCTLTALFAAHMLYQKGILVHPLFYPIVPQKAARLRFFITALHTHEEIESAVAETIDAVHKARKLAAKELAHHSPVNPQS